MKHNEPFRNPTLSLSLRVADLLSRLTLDEKIKLLSGHHEAIPRLSIPEWNVGAEVARGLVGRDAAHYTTVFPQPIGMASTFDPVLMRQIGEIAGDEARAYYNAEPTGFLMVWGPTVDMERDPRWGRTEEAYGEDPFLTGEMTVAYTLGLRGEYADCMKTIPTLKHFCANNNETDRCTCSANLEPRLRHEYYYAAFKPAITRGGAASIMTAYNCLNDLPAVLNPDLRAILKEEWGLDFVVTDGGDFTENVTQHHCFASHAESLAACIHAGVDSFSDVSATVHAAAYEALSRGLLTEKELDTAVGNVLSGRFKLGLFDPQTPYDFITRDVLCSPQSQAVNLLAAKMGMTLLKNNGLLPLKKASAKRIAFLGPTAAECFRDWYTGISPSVVTPIAGMREEFSDSEILCDTGYDRIAIVAPNGYYLSARADGTIYADQSAVGDAETFELHDWGNGWVNLFSVSQGKYLRVSDQNTVLLHNDFVFEWFTRESLNLEAVGEQVVISEYLHHRQFALNEAGQLVARPFVRPSAAAAFRCELLEDGAARAGSLAAQADVAILCVGNDPMQVAKETLDRTDLALPPHQSALTAAVAAANSNSVLAIISSYPFTICREQETFAAILYTSHAGPTLGTALAQTLSGRNNPAGRTPITWYRSIADLPDMMDYDIAKNKTTYLYFDGTPLYPFGHGLSYASFSYTDVTVISTPFQLQVQVTLENTADCAGDEVVQIYYTPLAPSVPRPLKKLCGFLRCCLQPGETKTVTISVPLTEFEFYDVSRRRLAMEAGDYQLSIGASSADIRLQTTVTLDGEVIPPRNLRKSTSAVLYDAKDGVRLGYSMRIAAEYVCCNTWNGWICFRNVDCACCTKLSIQAASAVDTRSVRVHMDGDSTPIAEFTVQASDSYEDFRQYTADIPQLEGTHDLTFQFGEHTAIASIRLF